MQRTVKIALLAMAAASCLATPASGQDSDLPYWASLRASEVNMRVGPSPNFPIAWVYRRPGLPIKVVRVMQGWRLIEDPDGTRGWMVASLLSRTRTAIVTGDSATEIRDEPSDDAKLDWKVEPGVTGKLGDCRGGWCDFDVAGREGWVRADRLWGDGEP